MRSLYVTNLGLAENLARTQILPYIEGVADGGVEVTILSFEKRHHIADSSMMTAIQERLLSRGIKWRYLVYHNRWGNILDMFAGFFTIVGISLRQGIDVIHARASIPVLMAYPAARLTGRKLIYDRRGTMVGDFVDDVNVSNVFSIGLMARIVDNLDLFLVRHSDAVIVLSRRAKEMLEWHNGRQHDVSRIMTVPCCADVAAIKATDRSTRPEVLNGRFTLCYLGSLGTCYLLDEMIAFFKRLKLANGKALFLIISHTERSFIEERLRKEELKEGTDYIIINLNSRDVAGWLRYCDASIMFIKPVECKIGSSPTKFGESLAAGVPVVINNGIGDTEEFIKDYRTGVIVNSFNDEEYDTSVAALTGLLEDKAGLAQRCVQVADTYFSMTDGIKRYRQVYRSLSSGEKNEI